MRVIVAIDQSAYSKQVVGAVTKRPWPENTSFKVLSVAPPLECTHEDVSGLEQLSRELLIRRKQAAEEKAEEARRLILNEVSGCTAHVDVRTGDPREQIIDTAAQWMADKIIIGAHGQKPNRFLGTIPQSVAQHAHCSVELVRLVPTSVKSKCGSECAASNKA